MPLKVSFFLHCLIPVLTGYRRHDAERKIVLLKTLIDLPSDHHPPYLHSDIQPNTHTSTHTRTCMHKHTQTRTHVQGHPSPRRPSVLCCDWVSGWPSVATCWPIDFPPVSEALLGVRMLVWTHTEADTHTHTCAHARTYDAGHRITCNSLVSITI